MERTGVGRQRSVSAVRPRNTTPESKRGQEIITHEARGICIHLFVREEKLSGGKAAPFAYFGRATYRSHQGSAPMSVVFSVQGP